MKKNDCQNTQQEAHGPHGVQVRLAAEEGLRSADQYGQEDL